MKRAGLATAESPTSASALGPDVDAASPVGVCAAAAIASGDSDWTCMGSARVDVRPPVRTSRLDAALDAARAEDGTASGELPVAPSVVTASSDDYDAWCETGTICRRNITAYISETKGNAAYGDQDGVIGTFDIILKTSLNGRSPVLQGIWDWDSGPAVEFSNTRITCREDQWGINPNCGTYYPDYNQNGMFTISRYDTRDTGRVIN